MKKKDIIISKGDGSRSKRLNPSQRNLLADEETLHQRALSMAIHQTELSQRFDGSMSRRVGSTSSRRLTLSDTLSNNKQVQVLFHTRSLSFLIKFDFFSCSLNFIMIRRFFYCKVSSAFET